MKLLKTLFGDPLVLASLGIVVVIAMASGVYYYIASRPPANTPIPQLGGASNTDITGTGDVEPAQNPDLAFAVGGRVAQVNVAVGQKVYAGQLLASLDNTSLNAQHAQAAATLKSQQAKLAEMQSGPRQVDVSAKQTIVAQANTTLTNLYASAPSNIAQAYDKSFSGISANTDTLYNQPNSPTPSVAFTTSNTQISVNASTARSSANIELIAWQNDIATLSSSAAPAATDSTLASSIAHLQVLRTFADTLLQALGNATPSISFSQSAITAAQSSVSMLRDTINTQILNLQSIQQQISSAKLAVQSAQDALNQVLAGSTAQDIEAQQAQVDAAAASVQNVDAQINNAIVVAPFSGTVASVRVKTGQIIAANTPAISLNPQSALQITVYLTEIDIAKIAVGDVADVTLDAYGTSRHFSATVISVDTSPTVQNNIPGYKTVLQFATVDPAIAAGMTANVTITPKQ